MGKFRNPSEKIIYEYFKISNYDILEHNYIIHLHDSKIEIDLICFHSLSNILHFVEVKSWENKNNYIHPVIKEIKYRKEKLEEASRLFIKNILENLENYKNKSEYNNLLCLLEKISPWDIPVSFDLIWVRNNKIEYFNNIF